ncbi:MAG: dihydrofolate reductase [Methylococcales bacterium]
MPNISIIVAMSENRIIGRDNQLPWHISADLKRFKAITMGKPIVMGRKTWQSLGRPLPGRDNVVLSRNQTFEALGCFVFPCLDDVIQHYAHEPEIMIIGGNAVYRLALPLAQRLYITQIHQHYEGDTFFPVISPQWKETCREDYKTRGDAPAFSFIEMEKQR